MIVLIGAGVGLLASQLVVRGLETLGITSEQSGAGAGDPLDQTVSLPGASDVRIGGDAQDDQVAIALGSSGLESSVSSAETAEGQGVGPAFDTLSDNGALLGGQVGDILSSLVADGSRASATASGTPSR